VGFNSARIIRRKDEENLWTSWQRSFGVERVSQAGELVGVGEIKRRRLYEIKPYVTGGWREGVPQIGRPGFDTGIQGKAGSCEDRHHSVSYFRVHGESRYGEAEVDN
jgi:hypothetical protein